MKDPAARTLPVEEALGIVLEQASPLSLETIPLGSAAGRVLAEEVLSDADQPPFPKAMMDGYARRSRDLDRLPVVLSVVEEIAAGQVPERTLAAGEAALIMTGAPVPEGADAVQMVEKTEPAGEGSVRILEAVGPGANIAPRGRDLKAGSLVLSPGHRLSPAGIGLLASAGRHEVGVRRAPRIAIAATGDELVEVHRAPGPGQIRNSNGPALAACARLQGSAPDEIGIVPDDRRALSAAIARGLSGDLLLLSGGVSMGVHDLVEDALEEQEVEIFFRKVSIRPGKPAVFGRKGACLVFGLPGNPVSSLVVFQVLAAPAIRKMLGLLHPEGKHLEAVVEEPIAQRPGRTAYLPGSLSFAGGLAHVRPLPTSGSADLLAHSRADVLLIVPSDRDHVAAGERVRVLLLLD